MNQDNQYPAFKPGDNVYLIDEKERYGMIVVPEGGRERRFQGRQIHLRAALRPA